ncbi:MAG: Rrf2 family transcriptional regulator [Kiritimatiellae bacterium]|nr:Rrf2 family transcriptional regulator [Kiritimatiellia bacterium]
MKITAKSRYALRILLDIAASGKDGPRTIKEIAASQGISEKFISRIAVPLRRAGLVATERGAKGGLSLARYPKRITLLDVVTATDGPLSLVRCLARPGACKRQGRCAAEKAWAGVNDALAAALRRTTLAQVVADQRRLAPPEPAEPDYCI